MKQKFITALLFLQFCFLSVVGQPSLSDAGSVYDICVDGQRAWIAGSNGLLSYDAVNGLRQETVIPEEWTKGRSWSVATADGTVYVGMYHGRIGRVTTNGLEEVAVLPDGDICSDLHAVAGGALFAGGRKLYRVKAGVAEPYTLPGSELQSSYQINDICDDGSSNLWIGARLNTDGVFRFREGALTKVSDKTGHVSRLAPDGKGGVWAVVSKMGSGLYHFASDGSVAWHEPSADGLVDAQSQCVAVDGNGMVWSGRTTLSGYDGTSWRHAALPEGRAAGCMVALGSKLLVGTAQGVMVFDGLSFTDVPSTVIDLSRPSVLPASSLPRYTIDGRRVPSPRPGMMIVEQGRKYVAR